MSARPGHHEVFARPVIALIDLARLGGLPLEPLFEGLPFDATSVRRLRRVDWADYCVLIERIESAAGGCEALERLVETSYHETLPEVRWIAGTLVSPKALFSFVHEVMCPIVFPAVTFVLEDLGADRVRLDTRLRPAARPCRIFFHHSAAGMRGMSRHLGLPPADVTADVGPDRGVYDVRFPPSRTVAARVGRAARAVLVRAVARMAHGWDDHSTRVETAARLWDLTPRQVRVLDLLARGDANKEIATALSCAENTVELHVTEILRKADVPTRARLIARFWSEI